MFPWGGIVGKLSVEFPSVRRCLGTDYRELYRLGPPFHHAPLDARHWHRGYRRVRRRRSKGSGRSMATAAFGARVRFMHFAASGKTGSKPPSAPRHVSQHWPAIPPRERPRADTRFDISMPRCSPSLRMVWIAPAPTGVAMRHTAGVIDCL